MNMAGDGPDRESLQEFARRNRLNAEFTGWVKTGQKMDLMEQADLVVVPSLWPGALWSESGSRQARTACRLWPTSRRDSRLVDCRVFGRTRVRSYPPTVEGLADAITRALSDPSHYAHLCRGAREVAGRFTWLRMFPN